MTLDDDIDLTIIDALSDKYMAGSGYAYVIISENLHITLNQNESVDNTLLNTGLSFVVEQGV